MKTTYKDNKWTGKFTWLWTFTNGSEGFINFNIAETSTESGKLKFTGIFYLVKKTGDTGNKWEVKYKKSVSGEKKAGKDDFDNYFPKPNSALSGADQSYWGFISNKDTDLGDICHEDSCKQVPNTPVAPVKKEFTWTKGNDNDKLLKDWAVDLTWWKTLYTEDNWALDSKISSFKGKWEQVQPSQG